LTSIRCTYASRLSPRPARQVLCGILYVLYTAIERVFLPQDSNSAPDDLLGRDVDVVAGVVGPRRSAVATSRSGHEPPWYPTFGNAALLGVGGVEVVVGVWWR
jgi:hypothetical protein